MNGFVRNIQAFVRITNAFFRNIQDFLRNTINLIVI